MKTENHSSSSFGRRETFLLFVYLGALAADVANDSGESQAIVHLASRIPSAKIPLNPFNAAQVYLSYCAGRSRIHNWMF